MNNNVQEQFAAGIMGLVQEAQAPPADMPAAVPEASPLVGALPIVPFEALQPGRHYILQDKHYLDNHDPQESGIYLVYIKQNPFRDGGSFVGAAVDVSPEDPDDAAAHEGLPGYGFGEFQVYIRKMFKDGVWQDYEFDEAGSPKRYIWNEITHGHSLNEDQEPEHFDYDANNNVKYMFCEPNEPMNPGGNININNNQQVYFENNIPMNGGRRRGSKSRGSKRRAQRSGSSRRTHKRRAVRKSRRAGSRRGAKKQKRLTRRRRAI